MYNASYAPKPVSAALYNAVNDLAITIMDEIYDGNYTYSPNELMILYVEGIQVALYEKRVVIGATFSHYPKDLERYYKFYNTISELNNLKAV